MPPTSRPAPHICAIAACSLHTLEDGQLGARALALTSLVGPALQCANRMHGDNMPWMPFRWLVFGDKV